MRMFFFTLFGLFLCVNHIYSQDSTEIHAEIYVNGSTTASLSKSQQNFLIIKGAGYESFELKITFGSATIAEKRGGYIVKPASCCDILTLSIIGRTGNTCAKLCDKTYKIVD